MRLPPSNTESNEAAEHNHVLLGAGILSVGTGQTDAARALGLGYWSTMCNS